MRDHRLVQWLIILLLVAVGVGLAGLSALPFASMRGWVDQFAGDGSAEPYTEALHKRLQLVLAAGSALCAILAGAAYFRRKTVGGPDTVTRDGRDFCLRARALARGLGFGLALVTLLAAGLRFPFLNQPMRFDESYTYLNYASRPLVILLATYGDPNNHVFHSACVHVTTRLLGSDPWAIRLPAFAAGVLIAPATMLLARAAGGRTAAWLAGLLTAASSPVIEYSTNARGYTLLALLTVLAWVLGTSLVRRDNRLGWWLLAGLLALGAWTIPVMAYPAAMLTVWIAWNGLRAGGRRRRKILTGLAITIAAGSGLTLLMYSPILLVSGPGSLIGNRYVAPLTWEQFLQGSHDALVDSSRLLLRDCAAPCVIVLAAGFLSGVARRRGLLLPAVATVLVCAALTAMQRVLPPPRAWLFLVPTGIVVAAVGFTGISAALTGLPRRVVLALFVLVSAAWPVANCFRAGSIPRSQETGVCPDARRIVEQLAPTLAPGEPILAIAPVSSPLVYYADQTGVARDHFAPLESREGPIGPVVVVVSRVHKQSLEDVLAALHAPAELQPGAFEPVARYPSAVVYRRTGAR